MDNKYYYRPKRNNLEANHSINTDEITNDNFENDNV